MTDPIIAKRFKNMYRAEIRRTQLTTKQITNATGLGRSTIKRYNTGQSVPTPENAARLAEAFNSDNIVIASHMERECISCHKRFTYSHRGSGKYCSPRCRNYFNKDAQKKNEFIRRGNELEIYHAAVDAFCRECVLAEMVCRDAECPLRPVSPIPLQEKKHVFKADTPILPLRIIERNAWSGGVALRRLAATNPTPRIEITRR
jgi:transcriptional regulator with XRE-family HTH domain